MFLYMYMSYLLKWKIKFPPPKLTPTLPYPVSQNEKKQWKYHVWKMFRKMDGWITDESRMNYGWIPRAWVRKGGDPPNLMKMMLLTNVSHFYGWTTDELRMNSKGLGQEGGRPPKSNEHTMTEPLIVITFSTTKVVCFGLFLVKVREGSFLLHFLLQKWSDLVYFGSRVDIW